MAKADQAEKDARAAADAALHPNDPAAAFLALTPVEIANGRQRPYRTFYRHIACTEPGKGHLNQRNAETIGLCSAIADNPGHRKRFWPCYFEGRLFPVAEFVWVTDDGKDTPIAVGS